MIVPCGTITAIKISSSHMCTCMQEKNFLACKRKFSWHSSLSPPFLPPYLSYRLCVEEKFSHAQENFLTIHLALSQFHPPLSDAPITLLSSKNCHLPFLSATMILSLKLVTAILSLSLHRLSLALEFIAHQCLLSLFATKIPLSLKITSLLFSFSFSVAILSLSLVCITYSFSLL